MMRSGAAVCLAFLAGAVPAGAAVIYVNGSAVGSNDGTSWADAYAELRDALAHAQPGDEVWVATGVYTPADAGSSFALGSGVEIYGGFAGWETLRAQRNWTANVTVLSGDVGRDDVYGQWVWYDGWNIHTDNCDQVVIATGVDASAVLDGVTVMAGDSGPGGGLWVSGASPTVRHCVFRRNLAAFGHGGAANVFDGNPSFTDCAFIENYVHLGAGGAVYASGASQPAFVRCGFFDNLSVGSTSPSAEGGAAALWSTLPIEMSDCRFERNTAVNRFGAFYAAYGGAIDNFGSPLTLRRCVFIDNSANQGGAVNTWDALTVVNCLFAGNYAAGYDTGSGGVDGIGGALCSSDFFGSQTLVLNSTIAANRATKAGGAWTREGGAVTTLQNTILWGNVADDPEIDPRARQFKGPLEATFSCVQDLFTAPPGEDPIDPSKYPGSIADDPRFVAPAADNFRLLSASPCIDTGSNALTPSDLQYDLDEQVRMVRGRGTGAPVVDMGAYEFGSHACRPDYNRDGVLDAFDYDDFVSAFFGYVLSGDGLPDYNADGYVDAFDYDDFVSEFFAGCA